MNIVATHSATHEVAVSFARPRLVTSTTPMRFRAAGRLLPVLENGQAITTKQLGAAITASFGGTDAQGFWVWKHAYEAAEAARPVPEKVRPGDRLGLGIFASQLGDADEDRRARADPYAAVAGE